jgi:nitrogen regulatory protein P-II 2
MLVKLKLVTIVAERLLKDRLLGEISELGARGYTLSDAPGRGNRGVRASEWEGLNVKIETVVDAPTAMRIVEHIAEVYFADFAVIVYQQDVEVVRGNKYI